MKTSALCVLAVVMLGACGGGSDTVEAATGADEGIPGVIAYEVGSRDHVEGPVRYDQSPPVGGPHADIWWQCGIYDELVPEERAVHSLEHGVVWVTYNPERLGPEALDELAALVAVEPKLLVSPFDHEEPMVLTAWGRQLRLGEYDRSVLVDFLTVYIAGEQSPEPGVPCDVPAEMEQPS